MKADVKLDCVGLYCPLPIAQTAMEVKQMKKGQVLEVISDDEGIKEDMPAWCKATGNELVSIEENKGQYKAYIRKN